MSFSRIYAVVLRQYYLLRGNPVRLLANFAWLVIGIIQWGFITKYLNTFNLATVNFATILLGAIILWEIFNRIQAGVLMTFLEDIWSKNFLNYFTSPLKISEYLSGLVLASMGTGFIGMIILVSIAGLGFGYNIFSLGFMIIPFVIVLLFFGIATGIFTTAIIFRYGPAAEWLGWPIPFFLSIFSGIFYPITALPAGLQWFSRLLPSAYIFESLRSILDNGNFSGVIANLIIGGILALVYFFLAYKFFVRVYRHNLKNGLLARFDAEAA